MYIQWLTSNANSNGSKYEMTKTNAVKLVLEQMAEVRSHDRVADEVREYALGRLFTVINSILGVSDATKSNRFRKIEAEFIAENK